MPLLKYLFLMLLSFFLCNSLLSQEGRTLVLIGKVVLMGESVGNKTDSIEINIKYYDKVLKDEARIVSINDSNSTFIPYNVKCEICFSYTGFQTKCLKVSTFNVLKSSGGYESGFEFPYEVKLVKSKEEKPVVVGEIYYNPVNDYFDFR